MTCGYLYVAPIRVVQHEMRKVMVALVFHILVRHVGNLLGSPSLSLRLATRYGFVSIANAYGYEISNADAGGKADDSRMVLMDPAAIERI